MWLPDIDVDKIIRLNRLGVSTKDIAERMGTQQQYVQKLLKKHFPDYVRYVRTGGKSSSGSEVEGNAVTTATTTVSVPAEGTK